MAEQRRGAPPAAARADAASGWPSCCSGLTRDALLAMAAAGARAGQAATRSDAIADVLEQLVATQRMKHKVKHIHFVGIGGAGMSGIAEVLLNLGYTVSRLRPGRQRRRRGACAQLGVRDRRSATTPQQHRRRRRGGHLDRGAGRQPRSDAPRARSASRSCRAR